MPEIVVEEVGRSGRVTGDFTAERRAQYKVWGTDDEALALAAVRTWIISEYGGTTRAALELDDLYAVEPLKDYWNCEAVWKTFARRSDPSALNNETEFRFELAVQPQRVLLPIGGISVYKAADEDDISVQLIGDRRDGQDPEGAEILEPTYSESVTKWIQAGQLTASFTQAIKRAVGKVNTLTFRGHAAGEALLVGVSGAKRGAYDWEINYRWLVRENQTNLTIAGITGINKGGWQYLWPMALDRAANGGIAKRVTHICVATVYNSTDLNALAI